ncbi:hypothetical protein OC842_000223 [Tilletia horrida]|uniref:Oxysterol-binding protein n=1 Tax=Tilletia horrida TaxID=155126 RepID=A0AAN6GIL9_9BASI|nr:hypothetical protein OC842_000223 [Tilletia horrida]KAK0566338.1 hypothetical protein OC844_000799 [Tilletia horrida]
MSSAATPALADSSNPDAAPETVNMTDADELAAANDAEASSESGRLKTLLGVLKRMLGVSDMAAVRLSLPANLLEPVGNLEYWTYLDRADLLTCLPELQDPLDRILAAVRFSMTKEFRYVRGNVCKPFNSILGEHFRCHWDFTPLSITEDGLVTPTASLLTSSPAQLHLVGGNAGASAAGGHSPSGDQSKGTFKGTFSPKRPSNNRSVSAADSIKSKLTPNSGGGGGGGGSSGGGLSGGGTISRFLSRGKSSGGSSNNSVASAAAAAAREAEEQEQAAAAAAKAKADADAADAGSDGDGGSFKSANDEDAQPASAGAATKSLEKGKQRVVFLTEQVSHHPPISSYYVECNAGPNSAVSLYGVDQISAKFTGTTVKVNAGSQNQGVFARIERGHGAGEEYQMTHPTASVNGLLRGNLWIALTDAEYVTCRGSEGKQLRAIVEHKDESWVGKAKYAFEGVVYEYEGDPEQYKRVKEVPQDKVLATIEGSWKGRITYTKRGEKEPRLLANIADLDTIPKSVRPLQSQGELESRRIWEPVISAILSKQYGEATKAKQVIEQRQRDIAAERRRKGEEFVPQYFETDISDGRPKLTKAGREAIEAEMNMEGY